MINKSNIKFSEELRVFVYGTLKPGEANYRLCENQVLTAKKAIASGKLYTLPMGYPAMTKGEGKVHGYLLSFADSTLLTALDDLEDYQPNRPMSENLYYRQYIKIFEPTGLSLGSAWVYLMTSEKIYQLGGVGLVDGYWKNSPEKV
ncbi:gamma-glutamylcyclotransferase family protein [Trichormus variabilis]|uniref:Gamma-glutamylcyclotransferase n=1 Tax=Trichormus variabilis SAG 1403-4b TaxID=447716 RepID=A0A433UEP8_ANAVA|nr:gamma-glutamylcyclotransferase [Trichormus variabilis]MBD2629873.1 gamma-glutamylcyclotransferase [Trichormus variabilis FACHB-164]RUS92314.1 gamma-glutamylcyclotransferase [Trichormus variabilis SAG 1403-4b]